MPLAPNEVLRNRYRIRSVLGAGGFGAVYMALDTSLNRVCAVKENLDVSGESRAQFEHEAQLLAQLKQPNLVQVFDYFIEASNFQYLVMEFVRGDNLAALVERDGALPEKQALVWIGEILDALAYLHGHAPPIVHRDVKPGNIIITPQGNAVLVDFGIAKTYVAGQKTTNAARAITPAFSPPEQYGTGTDTRSDLYSLGATMYYVLTGNAPAESVDRLSNPALLQNPRVLNPSLSPHIAQLMLRALELKPEQRFATAAEMRAALTRPIVSDRVPCPSCEKLNRRESNFCSYCGKSMIAPPPFRVSARPPIAGALQITLREGLDPVKAKLFEEQRGARIQTIINDILYRQFTVKGATFMLRGIRGCGMSRVAQALREEMDRDKRAHLVAVVNLGERVEHEQDARTVQEFMWGMKQNSGTLSQKMQKAVNKYVRDYVHDLEAMRGEREIRSEVEFSFPKFQVGLPEMSTPVGELGLFEIKQKKSETRRPRAGDEFQDRSVVLVNALRELLDYLVKEHARVVLIVDGLADLKLLRPLRPLTKMQQVFFLTVVETKLLAQWQADPSYAELLRDFGRERYYLQCNWELARELLQRMTRGRSEADNPAFQRFIKYVEFQGAGLPSVIVDTIKNYCTELRISPNRSAFDWFPQEQVTHTLQVPPTELPLIFAAAEWNDFLVARWNDISKHSDHLSIIGDEAMDAAHVATYHLCQWLFQQAQTGQHPRLSDVMQYAERQGEFTANNKWLVTNVVEWMRQDGLAKYDREERLHFETALEN